VHIEDDVEAPDSINWDSNVAVEIDGDIVVEQDEQEEDEEEEDEDEDDGKEPRTIVQGEMVHTSASDVDNMVDDQRIVVHEHSQEKGKDTARPQPPAPAPQQQQTPQPRPQLRMPETPPLTGLEH